MNDFLQDVRGALRRAQAAHQRFRDALSRSDSTPALSEVLLDLGQAVASLNSAQQRLVEMSRPRGGAPW